MMMLRAWRAGGGLRGSSGAAAFGSVAREEVAVDNPFTGETFCRVGLMREAEVLEQQRQAAAAQREWARVDVAARVDVCRAFLDYFERNEAEVCRDISGQMGKTLGQAKGEIGGLRERTLAMMDLAPKALSPITLGATPNNTDTKNFHRAIVREPLGVVLTLAPWNFPLLTAVNSVVPAVLAGNAVVLSHGFRAPLVADHFARAFEEAGASKGLVSALKCNYEVLHKGIRGGLYDFVSFTGSVPGGRAVNESVGRSERFIDATLELGGNDGAYVAADADMDTAVATVVDGGLFNAGQSCCGTERAFVHASLYDDFLERAVAEVARAYGVLGDPSDPATNMGPMAQPQAVGHLTRLVEDARGKGARVLTGGGPPADAGRARFFAPTLLADCNASMELMVEESFGPVIAIQKVHSEQEAIEAVNRSKYGLTSTIFTNDEAAAERYAAQVDVGTVFMNRADYLDPYMPWQGRKDTGKGLSLSHLVFDALTRPKNHHFKRVVS